MKTVYVVANKFNDHVPGVFSRQEFAASAAYGVGRGYEVRKYQLDASAVLFAYQVLMRADGSIGFVYEVNNVEQMVPSADVPAGTVHVVFARNKDEAAEQVQRRWGV